MSSAIYRVEDPDLETIKLGAVYRIRAPRTGEPWALYKIADDCDVSSVEPLEVPDWWDDAYEYEVGDRRIWRRVVRLAHDAFLANATLEVTLVPIDDEGEDVDSRALLYRFTWLY